MKNYGILMVMIVFLPIMLLAFPEQAGKKYSGERGDFSFYQTDVKHVIILFARKYHLNIALDSKISGKVTLKLKNVPWDQALDLILKQNGLAVVKIYNKDKGQVKEFKIVKLKKSP